MQTLLTFVLGLVSAYLATQWKVRKDLEADYDRDLRASRIGAYKELWKLLEPLAKYSPAGPVDVEVARGLSSGLRHWYYHTGGLFLSGSSRDAYFGLQDALESAIDAWRGLDGGHAPPPDPAVLKARGSDLRTATAADVGTRRASAVAAA